MPTSSRILIALAILAAGVLWVFSLPKREDSAWYQRPSSSPLHADAPEIVELARGEREPGTPRASLDPIARLDVLVTDESGSGIPFASVFGGEVLHHFGECDDRGSLQVPCSPGIRQVLARADGFSLGEKSLNPPCPGVVHLILHRGSPIGGVVVDQEDLVVEQGFLVLAYPARWPTSSGRFSLTSALQSPYVVLTATDSQGRFVLEGLRPTDEYVILAGGKGCLSLDPFVRAKAGDDVKIVVSQVYGLSLRLIETGGSPIRCTDRYVLSLGESAFSSTPGARYHPALKFIELAGLEMSEVSSPSRRTYFFTTSLAAAPAIPGIEVSVAPPGYLADHCVVTAWPIRDGLQHEDLVLQPTARGWGRVTLTFTGTTRDRIPTVPPYELHLNPLWGDRGSIALEVPDLTGPHQFEGIPCGRYHARLAHPSTGFRYPPAGDDACLVDVEPDQGNLEVTLDSMAEIELVCSNSQGEPYDGLLGVSIAKGTIENGTLSGSGGPLLLPSPPYVIQGLLPGTYCLSVKVPHGACFQDGRSWALLEITDSIRIRKSLLLQ
jgi:hypothetical protein